MNNVKFISGYSINTPYEKQINKILIPSFQKFNLNYWIKPFESLHNWQKNSSNKINIIIEAMNLFTENIVWIDADAEIKTTPILFSEIPDKYDLAVHWLDWKKHFGYNFSRTLELLDGTFYIRNTKKIKEFIQLWKSKSIDQNQRHRGVLENLLSIHKEIKVYSLPWEYCYISTTPKGNTLNPIKNPVIEHYQLSRTARITIK